jgi:hypothetical protein
LEDSWQGVSTGAQLSPASEGGRQLQKAMSVQPSSTNRQSFSCGIHQNTQEPSQGGWEPLEPSTVGMQSVWASSQFSQGNEGGRQGQSEWQPSLILDQLQAPVAVLGRHSQSQPSTQVGL